MSEKTFAERFKAARRAAVPLLAVKTLDAVATEARLVDLLKSDSEKVLETPCISWNFINGWQRLNDSAEAAIRVALGGPKLTNEQLKEKELPKHPTLPTINRVECMVNALRLPGMLKSETVIKPGSVLFVHGLSRLVSSNAENLPLVQAIMNLRDPFKDDLRMLVLLGPDFDLPTELAQHFVILDEPLPTDDELTVLASSMTKNKGIKLDAAQLASATAALRGLSLFPAEQALAMCSSKTEGLDLEALWENKRQIVNQTPGLSIWSGKERAEDVGGCKEIKTFLYDILTGKNAPQVVVHLDEIEKDLGGHERDTSGVSQDFLAMLLQEMQDNYYPGLMLVGVAGCAKSLIAKSAGSMIGIPTIRMSLGGMKDSLLGKSQQNMRHACKVVKAVGDGRAMFIATSNNITGLPAEFRARFTLGTWFADTPNAEEARAIWAIQVKAFGLKDHVTPDILTRTEGWTGREIRQACDLASRTNKPLEQQLARVVPVCQVDKERIQSLRQQAAEGFLSIARPGIYKLEQSEENDRQALPERRFSRTPGRRATMID